MTTLNAKAAREQFSAMLAKVARGESVTITRRGRAIAHVSPVARAARKRLPDLTEFRRRLEKPGSLEMTIADLRQAERA